MISNQDLEIDQDHEVNLLSSLHLSIFNTFETLIICCGFGYKTYKDCFNDKRHPKLQLAKLFSPSANIQNLLTLASIFSI